MVRAATNRTVDIRREAKHCPACKLRFTREAGFCPFDGTKLESAPFDPLADPLVGARVDGRYDVVSVLGEGGMGRIYEVRHAALDRAFAMKVLRPDLAKDDDLAARFILEAKATAAVKHPNIVQISDFGRLPDGVPFFVMELLVGHTLAEVIKAGRPIPRARAVRILRKVAGALAAAHAAGVVHRDLKPENVFLVGGARDVAEVRIVDFGAAKIIGSARLTRAGVVFGTPHYMSPEQASGHVVDARADIYSLGVIMYEMFCGKVPFEAETYMGVLTQHMFARPVRPSEIPGVPRDLGELEDIIMACLAKNPEGRFASMDDLAAALDRIAGHDGDADADLAHAFATRGERVPRRRDPGPLAMEPPTFAEIRRSIDGWEPRAPHRARLRWVYVVYAAAAGLLLVSFMAVWWFLLHSPPAASPVVARVAPDAAPREVVPEVVLSVPPLVPPAAAPSVGQAPPAQGRAVPPPNRHKAKPGSDLDDVGDPFTQH